MDHEHRALDVVTLVSAGMAAVSLANAALVLTIISTIIAIPLGILRLRIAWREWRRG